MITKSKKEILYWICVWRQLKVHCFKVGLWWTALGTGILITLMFLIENAENPSRSSDILLAPIFICSIIVIMKIADAFVKGNELHSRLISMMEIRFSKKSL